MDKTKENLPRKGRLGNFVLPDKEAVNKNLSQFQLKVNTKNDVEATMDIFFGMMPRLKRMK